MLVLVLLEVVVADVVLVLELMLVLVDVAVVDVVHDVKLVMWS